MLYIDTHGNPAPYHLSGDDTAIKPWDYQVPGGQWIPGYEQQRQLHIGSGYPPFNSLTMPAINYSQLEACDTGISNDFIRACWPYWNGYSQWLEDQAFLSYTVTVYVAQAVRRAQLIWDQLADGWTLATGRTWLIANAEDEEIMVLDNGQKRLLTWGDVAIHGDTAMRVKSVWTGTHVAPVGWYR